MIPSHASIIQGIEEQLQIRVLTNEYEIVSFFLDHTHLTAQQLFDMSHASNTAFYKHLKTLVAKGALQFEENPEDKRSKIYSLTPRAKAATRMQNGRYVESYQKKFHISDSKKNLFHTYGSSIRNELKLNYTSCEYQILLFIYENHGMTNLQFGDLLNVSLSKFNQTLKMLLEMGLIYFRKDSADQRKKHYYLSDHASETIRDGQEKMYRWLLANPSLTQIDEDQL